MELPGIEMIVYVIPIIIGIPLFYIWRYVYRKKFKTKSTRIIITWVSTIISSTLIYATIMAVISSFVFNINTDYPKRKFDKKAG